MMASDDGPSPSEQELVRAAIARLRELPIHVFVFDPELASLVRQIKAVKATHP